MDASAHLRMKKHMIHYANYLSLSGNNITSSHRATGGLHMSLREGAIHMDVEQKEAIVNKYNAPPPVEVPVETQAEVVAEPTPVPVEVPAEVPVEVPVKVPVEVVTEPTPAPVEAPCRSPCRSPR